MIIMKKVKLFHWSGTEYLIENIPTVDKSQQFLIELHFQKLIDEIEIKPKPQEKYSFIEYLQNKGIHSLNSVFHSPA